jgi:AAA domain-containing protein/relaxase-like protein/DNA relaxase TraI-like protein/RNA helicase
VIAFKGGRVSAGGKRSGLGSGFGSLVSYLKHGKAGSLSNPERVAWVSYRNLDGISDPTLAARLMRAYAEENPRVERPVYHFGLSLSPGEHLTPEQWDAAVDRVLARMGLSEHQALVMAHGDTDREHVHIVVNRVGQDGRAWEVRRDMVRAYEAVHEIESEHGLRRTGESALAPPDLSPGAHQRARRTGQQPLADRVRQEAGPALARATSWRQLDEWLAARGFRLESAEHGSGVVVADGVRRASLSHVDRDLSGPKLAQRFGETFREYRARDPEIPALQAPAGLGAAEPLPGRTLVERADALVERVLVTRATFTEADLKRAAFYQKDSEALIREALKPAHAIEIGKELAGATRYTSKRYLGAEERLFSSAGNLAVRDGLRLGAEDVARTLERSASHLSDEQRAAVYHATTEADFAQIVGHAGTGKTSVARAIAEIYREQGYEVRGAALAGKAAEGLEREAGIPSRTLASFERAWAERRDWLDSRTVLVVDEAGMVDSRQLGRVLHEADRGRAKVVLLGDPEQLKAIGAGDAYRGLLERHPYARLETIRRQAEPWQRTASEHLAAGRTTSALDAYDAAGRLHWTDSRDGARAQLVARYLEDRRSNPEASQLIVAYRNGDARQLNEAVRAERRAAGELGPGVRAGSAEYAAGDRIVFLKNDHAGRDVVNLDSGVRPAGVKNGTLGTVEQAESQRFVVRLDDGRRVAFDPERYGSIAHGYAVTLHKSQGATVDRVYTLADPYMDRNATYVALTRHREAVHLYADRQTFAGRDALDGALSRPSRKDLAQDYAAADLLRIAVRSEAWHRQVQALRGDENSLKAGLAALDQAATARRELGAADVALRQAAARVYIDPEAAIASLRADRQVHERLAAGQAGAYGSLRGRERTLLGKDAERSQAESAVPRLRAALWKYQETEEKLTRHQTAAATLATDVPNAEARLARLTASFSRGPEQTLGLAEPSRQGIGRSETPRRDLEATRAAVQKAAARIYSDPQEATRALLADPKALDRLAAGEVRAYGDLRLNVVHLLDKEGQRSGAENPLPRLRATLWAYRESEQRLVRPPRLAATVGSDVLEIKALLGRVTSALRQVEALSRDPERALELAVRRTSMAAVHATISLLPDPIKTPVRLVMRAAERVLGIGLDLGR